MSSGLTYTKQQADAIQTRGVSVALDAGAGCGKTFVLTERFLSHLAPGDDALELHELVAITFTDAAAREMRQRVRAKCLERLRAATGDEADHWLRLLRVLDSARVSTIHAFCSALVRTYALELGLDPGFTVLDQSAADVLMSEATDDCLRMALDRQDEDAMQLAAEFGLGGLKARLAPLRDHVGGQLGEWVDKPTEETITAWRGYFNKVVEPAARERLAQLPEIERVRSLIPESTASVETQSKLAELDALLAKVQTQEATLEELNQVPTLARVQGVCGKRGDWPSDEIKKRYGDACSKLRDHFKKLPTWVADESQVEAAEMGRRLARVAQSVAAAYQQVKQAAGSLDFDDLLSLARRLTTEEQFTSVQRRLRGSVKLLLVDEFQDTNRVQADIVTSLVGQRLEHGGLFYVGDFKQSIYRFRGAEPRVFRDLQGRTPVEGRLPLSQNFRSQPAVLQFVNALFAPLFGKDYTPLSASRSQVGPKPAVKFLWAEVAEKTNVDTARKAEARRIARHIQRLLADPTPRVAVKDEQGAWTARRVVEGDIAILFRALSDVQHYEEALRGAGIEHHLIGGHAFYSQQEVFDLLNLLQSVASECDEVSLAGVLRSPFFALEDETLFWLNRAAGSLNASLARNAMVKELSEVQQLRVDRARRVLKELRGMRGVADTAEVIRVALERTGYDAALAAEYLGQRKQANLLKIVEQARAADRARPGDIDAFVRQLGEFISRQPKEALAATAVEESDRVRLMTVHHAKGLEFPVVFVADLSRRLQPDTTRSAFDPLLGPLVKPNDTESNSLTGLRLYQHEQSRLEREESVRLFYVACTRAADLLVLSASVENPEQPRGEWLERLGEVFNLQTGAMLSAKGELLAEVVPQEAKQENAETTPQRQPDLLKFLKKAQDSTGKPAPIDPKVAAITLDPLDLQRFSVSRLSGKLHYRAEARRASDEAALREEINPLKFGTLVHAVMERVDFANSTRVGEWCRSLAPLHLTRNWDAAADEAGELVNRFLDSDRCQALREAQEVQREIEFLMRWPIDGNGPPALLQGYIDLLYRDASGNWRLLDYKTNQIAAAGVPVEAESYRLQMAVYALAIEQATGESPASLDVHFLRPGIEHSFVWSNESRTAAIASINEAIQTARTEAVQHA